ncbi:putative protein with an alpha/beta hydrolase fold protein [Lactococcus lactis subsp. lactis]|uniref:Alpha/beta hydrolase n=2 Tax=Lactococcus lactis TaxID=1358 RepID=A0A2N5WC37_LACLL|nr:alpha/beta hydrolase [Lactococcus lactis]PLW59801.1 putative protein with an alpha/beta hydrolase fold protein [Lactococcus lactis subsp. lactis]
MLMKKRQVRKKLKAKFYVLVSLAILISIGLILNGFKGVDSRVKNDTIEGDKKNTTLTKQIIYPTIYITGSGGDVSSVDRLVSHILPVQNVAAKKSLAITANISRNYELKVEGEISKDNRYPLIEFGTVKGTDSGELYSKGMQKAVDYLIGHYKVPWINIVGFSSGATGAVYYMIDTATNEKFPPINKYVSLEGEYNKATGLQVGETLADVLVNGPLLKTSMYQYIADGYRKISPKVQMMLLEGDFNTVKQTDSAMPWADGFSIYHLFKENGNEVTMTLYPTKTSHSKAPTNPIVVQYVKNFIYETP